jgi:hypothetical protein
MLSRNRKQDILEKLADAKSNKKVETIREVVPDKELKPAKKHDTVYGLISSGWDKAKANQGKLVSHSSSQTDIVEGGRRRVAANKKLRSEQTNRTTFERGAGAIQDHLKRTGLIPRLPGKG